MRQANRAALLDIVWSTDDPVTATDLMTASGLTRATVLDVCRDLQRRGWLREVAGAVSLTPGRQALRFGFNLARTHILGADIGRRSLTVAVADLSGRIIGRDTRRFADSDDRSRSAHFEEVVQGAIAQAGLDAEQISVACIGIAAPVTPDGSPPARSWFWDSVALDGVAVTRLHPGWRVHVENDANLAALAEVGSDDVEEGSTFLTLLSGERLGGGLVLGGQLHRGAHGTAGEMDYLERVVGVDGSHGIALLARILAAEGLREGRPSTLRATAGGDTQEPRAVEVLRAAEAGDPLAVEVVERIAEKLSITISTIGSLIDPATVVIAGGIAEFSAPVVDAVRRRMARLGPTSPRVVISTLGRDVVLRGALRLAADEVRRLALTEVA